MFTNIFVTSNSLYEIPKGDFDNKFVKLFQGMREFCMTLGSIYVLRSKLSRLKKSNILVIEGGTKKIDKRINLDKRIK